MNYSEQTAATLGRAIEAGKADPVEITEHFLEAIHQHPESEQIFARLSEDRARKEAQLASQRAKSGMRKGPLDGVPVSWKDLYDTAGIATESGAPLLKGRVPAVDAEVLTLAGSAGTVCLGKTHQTEFAFSGLGINPKTATSPNRLLPGHVPGGSSSGAAASISFGLAPVAIGSDTGGSVRIPACWNSLVGMKTTYGLLSLQNVVPLCHGFDTVGPLAKTVEDAALMVAAMGGGKADLSNLPTVHDLHFAIIETAALDGCDGTQMGAFERSIKQIEKAGVRIDRIKATEFADVLGLGATLFPYEAWQQWGDLIEANPGMMYGPVEARFKLGKSVTKTDYLHAWDELKHQRTSFFAKVKKYDGILLPTTPVQPPLVAELLADEAKFTAVNLLALRNTRFGNLLGTCALTLPTATPAAGLQIMGKPMEDQRCLQIGALLEKLAIG